MKTFGRYLIEEFLGQGPIASVYRARDGEELVALKVLHPQLASDELIRERFRREALDARALKHPNIAQVFDVAVEERGIAIVGEYCPGGSLEGWKAPNPAELESFAAQAARALECAHAAGLIHRDLKPANVLRGADGSMKLADFGSAGIQDLVGLTATTSFLGKPQFIAPESLDSPYPDPRWDLYSLGACLYLAGTGKPHADRSMQGLFDHGRAFPPPQEIEASIPPWLGRIIVSLLGPIGERPRGAAELSRLLTERGSPAKASKECLSCGAGMPAAASVCPSCLRPDPDLSPRHGPGSVAVVLSKVCEEAGPLKELGRIMKIVSGDPGKHARFITEDARMYSKAERERYAAMPCRLVDSLSPASADFLVELIALRCGGKVKAKAMDMGKATRRAKKPALMEAGARFRLGSDSSSIQGSAFERDALERLGGPAGDAVPGPALPPGGGNAPQRRREGADLASAARACLCRALSLGAEAGAFKASLMDVVAKASALMDRLDSTRARLDSVSLGAIYASIKRLEERAATGDDPREVDQAMREKARLLEAYQGFTELEREAFALNRRILLAAAALDALASLPADAPLPDIGPVLAVLEG